MSYMCWGGGRQRPNGGLGIGDVLLVTLIVFTVLQATGTIDWPWWWVLSPLWVGFGIFLLCYLVIVLRDALEDRRKLRAAMKKVWDEEDETE